MNGSKLFDSSANRFKALIFTWEIMMEPLMQPLDVATAASHATMAQPVGEKTWGNN